jgi:hypothetical protein
MKLKYNFSKFNVLAKVEEYFVDSFVKIEDKEYFPCSLDGCVKSLNDTCVGSPPARS